METKEVETGSPEVLPEPLEGLPNSEGQTRLDTDFLEVDKTLMTQSFPIRGFLPDVPLVVDPKYLSYDFETPPAILSRYEDIDVLAWSPEEFTRQPSGSSVVEPDSVLGESGRFYHGYKEGKYFMPNDAAEQDRLDFQHAALTLLIGDKLAVAPIKSPKHVLDIATGTGIWAIEFAQQYPDSHVVGVDLSKIQPENAPPNVEFIKDDSEEEWFFPYKFDFVHARAVFTCFNNQKTVMKHAYDNLNPGGYIEYLDGTFDVGCLDGTIEGTSLQRWGILMNKGAAARGRDLCVTQHFKRWLTETGFVDIIEKKLPWAYSPWPEDKRLKMAGRYMNSNIHDGIRGISWVMLTAAGLTADEIDKLILEVRADLKNPTIHAFMPVWSVYGRKPYDWEISHPM